jgi:hypothetical protein
MSAPAPDVVAPPPATTVSNASRVLARSAPSLGAPSVVPPPPSLAGGSGRKSTGLGAPLDAGAPLAPPTTAGSGPNAGAVISSQPGPKIGLPSNGATGSLAMSPSGGEKPGLGGAGAGAGIGHGTGPGSGLNGSGPGAGRTDAGHGSDPNSRAGISPTAGPGGAGSTPSGSPAVPGVDISGGNTVVNLPSFGSDPSGGEVVAPSHTPAIKHSKTLDVTIVATASSGGAFEPYKSLMHGQTYTTYIDTSLGSVVMQFSEAVPSNQPGGITAPQSIRTDLPDNLPHGRIVISCTLDRDGNLKGLRVREAGPAEMTAKIMDALPSWKFQPAMRGDQPVEVTAILGFGIDTNDRN